MVNALKNSRVLTRIIKTVIFKTYVSLVVTMLGEVMAENIKQVTDASFQKDVLGSGTPVLVDFWAEWCGPCRAIAPKLEEIANEMGTQVVIAKINVDENPNTPSQFGIRGIPTLLLFKGGKQVDQVVGNQPKDSIVQMIKRHL